MNEIVVTLGRTDNPAHYRQTSQLLAALPQPHRIVWASGPRFLELYKLLDENNLSAREDGKGRSAWTAYGYVLARDESKVIALHDCDIVNFSREMLARLFYPVASPHIDYAFCKGYYARVTDRIHGRVTRLFVTPLVRSLMFAHQLQFVGRAQQILGRWWRIRRGRRGGTRARAGKRGAGRGRRTRGK